MSRKSRMADIREAKDRRMKKIAIGGAVLLAVVLAFEVPKVLHRGGSSSSTPPAATTTPGDYSSTPSSTPTSTPSGTAAAAVLPTAPTKLTNSDIAPKRTKSELYSFNHFAGKDPFVQQVQDLTVGQSNGDNGQGADAGSTSATSGGTVNLTSSTSAPKKSSVRTLATTSAVQIDVNGKVQTVRVGKSFPSSNPLFKLVSVSNGAARIAIANGSYASGAQTVSLVNGRTLTLVDTADGIRYKIRLVSA
jgi:hypothetical protein